MTTPKDVFEGRITQTVQNLPGNEDVIYQFRIEGEAGCDYVVDLNDNSVTPGTTDNPGATILVSDTDFIDMVEGRVAGPNLFMMGKLRVEGNIALAMKLGQIF
ncbi:MAG: SCP2 sterol-binding domain-containing protein [Myxococcota bacterium]|nr:SCP2 sterol-binding domain-containing protein [Myxococcota bacterium]